MRSCTINGRTGLITAQDGKAGVPATQVFVLFDDNRPSESDAAWFPVHSVLPTGVINGSF